MANDVTLILKANNSDHVNKMRQAQKETQKVYDTAEKGGRREKGILEEIDARLVSLEKRKRAAFSIEDIAKYNKKIQETKQYLQEYEQAGIRAQEKVKKSTNQTYEAVLKMAGTYLTVRGAIKVLQETALAFFTKSEEGMDLVARKTSNFKAQLGVLQGEFIKLGKQAVEESKKKGGLVGIWDMMWQGYKKIEGAGLKLLFPNAAKKVAEVSAKMQEAGQVAEELTRKQQELENIEIKMIEQRAQATFAIKEARTLAAQNPDDILKNIENLKKSIEVENKAADDEINLQHQKVEIIKALNKEKDKQGKLTRDDQRALAEAVAEEINLRTESYGREFRALNAINALVKEYKDSFKDLQATEKIAGAGETGTPDFMMGLVPFQSQKVKDKWLADMMALGERAKKANEAIEKANKDATENEKKTWDERAKAIKQGAELIENILTTFVNQQYENAQRNRELLDTRLSELEQELQTEVELYKAGYASNVNEKKLEIKRLKELRDNALVEETAALKRKQKLEAASQAIDIASSIMSILRMTFKNSKTWWQALISAGVGIGAMFGLISSSKKQIGAATKLAKGGSGTDTGVIRGRTHAEGGERFVDHIEVERGEAWGVLSNAATRKYGKVFHHMVSSFNKGEIPKILPVTNSIDNKVLVNNNGSNSRLDQLIAENRKLNKKLTGEFITDLGGKILVRKGNTVRTIRQ